VKKGELLIWRKNGNSPHCARVRTEAIFSLVIVLFFTDTHQGLIMTWLVQWTFTDIQLMNKLAKLNTKVLATQQNRLN
jgi:hypothetical protein